MNQFKNEKTIESEFTAMLFSAKSYFETENHKNYEYHQCLVLTTVQGEQMIYPVSSDSAEMLINQQCSIISELEKEGKTAIQKMICMWKGNDVDVPSFQFMKKLCELNPENKETEVLLSAGNEAYVTRKINDVIGKFV